MQISAHKQRLATGFLLAGVLAFALVTGGWVLRSLLLAASLVGMWEFYQMCSPGKTMVLRKILALVCGAGVVCTFGTSAQGPLLFIALLFLISALCFLFDFGTGNTEALLTKHSVLIFGVLYIPLTLALTLTLTAYEQTLIIVAAIATDAGGYYVGNFCGMHKIWPMVSPKKSWQGSIGGLVLTMLVCLAFGTVGLFKGLPLPKFSWIGWLVLGAFLNIAAQLGDFFESALKRTLKIKDASQLLPGHGGLLDRMDSILFVVLAYVFVRLLYDIIPRLTTLA